MSILLGSLQLSTALENLQLAAPPVQAALHSMVDVGFVGIAAIDASLSDTANFCAHYGVSLEQAADCVIVEGRNGQERVLAALLLPNNNRVASSWGCSSSVVAV